MEIAVKAHANQYDKSDDPYIMHVIRVWDAVRNSTVWNTEAQVTAWLHDTVEDTDVTLDRIYQEFGDEVGNAVDAITKRKGETLVQYYMRVRANPIAKIVKWADLNDNFRRNHKLTDEETRLRMARKYSLGFDMLR